MWESVIKRAMKDVEQLQDFATQGKGPVLAYLVQAFPRLAEEAEDIFQAAFLEALEKVRQEGFAPSEGWLAWFRWTCRNRALDRLRAGEREMFQRLFHQTSQGEEATSPVPDHAPGPSTIVVEGERRARQGILLSQVLSDFCRWCEARPDGFRMKTIYERRLRSESAEEIARALGVSRNVVDVTVKRARTWIYERICRADVDRSVFATMHAGRGDAPRQAPPQPHPPSRRNRPGEVRPNQFAAERVHVLPGNPPQTLAEVVRWVVDELGALCPSRERLEAYSTAPDESSLEDVRYHVEVARCRICTVLLQKAG